MPFGFLGKIFVLHWRRKYCCKIFSLIFFFLKCMAIKWLETCYVECFMFPHSNGLQVTKLSCCAAVWVKKKLQERREEQEFATRPQCIPLPWPCMETTFGNKVPRDRSVHHVGGRLWHQSHHNVCLKGEWCLPETKGLGKCPYHCKRGQDHVCFT